MEVTFDDFEDEAFDISLGKTNQLSDKPSRISYFSKYREKLDERVRGLDEYQSQVVSAPLSSSMEIRAAAGSGKTTTSVTRALRLIIEEGVHPHKICLTAFNNKAATDLLSRFNDFFDDFTLPLPHVSTLHRLGTRIHFQELGNSRNLIITQYHMYKYAQSILEKYVETPTKELVGAFLISMDNLYSHGFVRTLVSAEFDKVGRMTKFKTPNLSSVPHLCESSRFTSLYLKRYKNMPKRNLPTRKQYAEHVYDKQQEWMNPIFSVMGDLGLELDVTKIMQDLIIDKLNKKHMTFGDMVYLPAWSGIDNELARKNMSSAFDHVIVDEAQDLDINQICLALHLDSESLDKYNKSFDAFLGSLKGGDK